MEQTQSPPSSPPLEGYDTAGEEVGASSGEETTLAIRQKWRKTPKKPTKRSPRQPVRQSTRIAKGRFTPARPGRRGGSDSDIGSAADLISVESLVWDAHAQPLNWTIGTRRWSVETQYGVPVGLEGGGERLSPHQEGRESAASSWIEQPPDTMAELDRVRDGVERALLEVEDKEESVKVKLSKVLGPVILCDSWIFADFFNNSWNWILWVCHFLVPILWAVSVGCL